MAGLDAGLVYNSFPKMGGQWIPQDLLDFSPRIKNFFENPTTVQFDHRVLVCNGAHLLPRCDDTLPQGVTTLSFVLGCWALARGVGVPRRAQIAANCLAGMAMTQVMVCVA